MSETPAVGPRPVADEPEDQPTRIGRLVTLHRLGAGGMGVVYAAYDPELDRKVALKLIHAGGQTSEAVARFTREARAMARLDHPNVVPIHDVGEHRGRLYIAMAYVEGTTLRAALAKRDLGWREVVRLFVAAGRGLAAAHAVGLVHRDFKPENVLVDREGRVRVTDFGLAKAGRAEAASAPADAAAVELTGRNVLGTPAYMSPEQIEGEAITAYADQFSFCVALWEGLFGERPFGGETAGEIAVNVLAQRRREPTAGGVPRWIRRAVERGLAKKPQERWPSMDALLAALERDPGRRWRRVGGSAALLGVGAAAVGGVTKLGADACPGAAAQLQGTWDDARREAVETAFVGTGTAFGVAAAERITTRLDAYADRWVAIADAACDATRRQGSRSERLFDLGVACLDRRRAALHALVDVFADADASVVAEADRAVGELPPLQTCEDPAALVADVAPPEDSAVARAVEEVRIALATADALRSTGRFAAGHDAAVAALAAAEATHFDPVVAEAWLARARTAREQGEYLPAQAHFEAAWHAALRGRADAVALDAALDRAMLEANELSDVAAANAWAEQADSFGARLERDAPAAVRRLREARQHRVRESVDVVGSKLASALDHAQAALAIDQEELGQNDPEVATDLANLCNIQFLAAAMDAAREACEGALRIRADVLGDRHPLTADALVALGNVIADDGDLDGGLARNREALQVLQEELGPTHPMTAKAQVNLGMTLRIRGDFTGSLEALSEARTALEAAYGETHPIIATVDQAIGNTLGDAGDILEAKAHYERALQVRKAVFGPRHPKVAHTMTNLATVIDDLGQLREALALVEAALAIRREVYGDRHVHVANSLANSASLHRRLGELDVAARESREVVEIYEAVYGNDHYEVGRSLGNLGNVLLAQGRLEEAEAAYRRAVAIMTGAYGAKHPKVAHHQIGLSKVLTRRGQTNEALGLLREAEPVLREAGDALRTGDLGLARADAQWEAGDHAAARASATAAQEAYTAAGEAGRDEVEESKAWLEAHR